MLFLRLLCEHQQLVDDIQPPVDDPGSLVVLSMRHKHSDVIDVAAERSQLIGERVAVVDYFPQSLLVH